MSGANYRFRIRSGNSGARALVYVAEFYFRLQLGSGARSWYGIFSIAFVDT